MFKWDKNIHFYLCYIVSFRPLFDVCLRTYANGFEWVSSPSVTRNHWRDFFFENVYGHKNEAN